jgi:hypothetical protein
MISLGITDFAAKPLRSAPSISISSLLDAQKWCSLSAPVKHNLRSPELDPASILQIRNREIHDREDIHRWVQETYEAYRRAVAEIAAKRSALLDATVPSSENAKSNYQGRLLLYHPQETVSDGAAEASSKGFFDAEDAPPWDTWLAYFEGGIVSWVPEHLISRAQVGIDANPVDCIHWLNTHQGFTCSVCSD